jgi:hypothetical protein
MRALGCIAQPFDDDFGHFVVVLNDRSLLTLEELTNFWTLLYSRQTNLK